MSFEISKALEREIEKILSKYPNKDAALLPALYAAQDEYGYVSKDVMVLLGKRLAISYAKVKAVATFYTMYNKKPVGKYHIQVCRNIACHLRGSKIVMETVKEVLNMEVGETKGKFTLTAVECLGACGTAPVMQINNDYHEELTKEKVVEILNSLK